MNLAQLQAFLSVAQHRSFSKAAKEKNLSQSGLSRQIQRLEKELGMTLIQRNLSNMQLTMAGERFKDYADNLLTQHREFLGKLREEDNTIPGKLRIIASLTPGEFLVPEFLKRFLNYHPGLQTELFISDSDRVIAELRDGRWDIGFVEKRLKSRGLYYNVIAEDEIVLVSSIHHPFGKRGKVKLSELEGQFFVEPEDGEGNLDSVMDLLAKKGLSLPSYKVIRVHSSSMTILLSVEKECGIGWVSSLALGPEWKRRVAIVRLEEMLLYRQIYMVQISWSPLPPVIRAFINCAYKEGRAVSQLAMLP